jgi:hypothetical protein
VRSDFYTNEELKEQAFMPKEIIKNWPEIYSDFGIIRAVNKATLLTMTIGLKFKFENIQKE